MSLFGYTAPQTLDDAIAVLSTNPSARPLAGGHSELLRVNRKKLTDSLLVDLRKIKSLQGIERDGKSIQIGAMTTIGSLAADSNVRESLPVLADTASMVGDAQTRNRATVGGNLAAAEQGADLPALLLALNVTLQLSGPSGTRTLAVADFVRNGLGRGELIERVTVPLPGNRSGIAYEKLKHPATLFALCGVAVYLEGDQGGAVGDARVALTGATGRVERLSRVEQALINKAVNGDAGAFAIRISDESLEFKDDLFASAEYRRHLAQVLTERAVKRAFAITAA